MKKFNSNGRNKVPNTNLERVSSNPFHTPFQLLSFIEELAASDIAVNTLMDMRVVIFLGWYGGFPKAHRSFLAFTSSWSRIALLRHAGSTSWPAISSGKWQLDEAFSDDYCDYISPDGGTSSVVSKDIVSDKK
ncbi:hypothetical protein HN51_052747 [Arachis hypogaea]|nr:uncharacterized protein DS421_17g598880 [Arachis hypogaea]